MICDIRQARFVELLLLLPLKLHSAAARGIEGQNPLHLGNLLTTLISSREIVNLLPSCDVFVCLTSYLVKLTLICSRCHGGSGLGDHQQEPVDRRAQKDHEPCKSVAC